MHFSHIDKFKCNKYTFLHSQRKIMISDTARLLKSYWYKVEKLRQLWFTFNGNRRRFKICFDKILNNNVTIRAKIVFLMTKKKDTLCTYYKKYDMNSCKCVDALLSYLFIGRPPCRCESQDWVLSRFGLRMPRDIWNRSPEKR